MISTNFIQHRIAKIFLISFLILFLELTLIRWVNSSITSISFYSNIIMLASFFGIGCGCLLDIKKNLFRIFPLLILILAISLFVSAILNLPISSLDDEIIMFKTPSFLDNKIPNYLIIIIVFSYITLIFLTLGQQLKFAFNNFAKPIDAYIFDLTGSLAGIIFFSIFSYFEIGLMLWIFVIFTIYFLLTNDQKSKFNFNALFICFITILLIFLNSNFYQNSWWSRYYFIDLKEFVKDQHYLISTDKTGHQEMTANPKESAWFYSIPYDYFKNSNYDDILIIGAGSGQDVASALTKNVKRIDAVDIEPRLVEIGKQFHPLKPYSDPRVNVIINDGRNFLENQKNKKYDLIIFALTDSLKLASNSTNTRLESYLLTNESFATAKSLLKDNGMLVLYNYYRKDWLVEKIIGSLNMVFQDKILSIQKNISTIQSGAFIVAGNKINDFEEQKFAKNLGFRYKFFDEKNISKNLYLGTDNWPFIYLLKPLIPHNYWVIIIYMLALNFSLIGFFIYKNLQENFSKKITKRNFLTTLPWHMFFLGAGFMMLETKNIINFQLLFGTTWLVNSLVFSGVLALALLSAILVKIKINFNKKILYFLMTISLILAIYIPLKSIINLPFFSKYLLAIAISLLPIFFANLIFSSNFAKQTDAGISFGLNMLGALIGGILEYISMISGYHFLLYIIAFCYLLAIIFVEFIFIKK